MTAEGGAAPPVAVLEGAATADAAVHLRPADFARIRKLAVELEQMARVSQAGLRALGIAGMKASTLLTGLYPPAVRER